MTMGYVLNAWLNEICWQLLCHTFRCVRCCVWLTIIHQSAIELIDIIQCNILPALSVVFVILCNVWNITHSQYQSAIIYACNSKCELTLHFDLVAMLYFCSLSPIQLQNVAEVMLRLPDTYNINSFDYHNDS